MNTSGILLDSKDFAPAVGEIEGAYCRDIDTTRHDNVKLADEMSEVYYLPAGQTMDAKPDDAFMVKEGNTSWLRADFYQPGQLKGPLIYSRVKVQTPRETLNNAERTMTIAAFLPMILLATIGLMFTLFGENGAIKEYPVLLVAALVVGWSLKTFVEFNIGVFKSDKIALKMLKKYEGKPHRFVFLESSERQILEKHISPANAGA